MRHFFVLVSACSLIALLSGAVIAQTPQTTAPVAAKGTQQRSSRQFEFSYGATVRNLPEGANVRVWVPIATSNRQQQVELLTTEASVAIAQANDAEYGNRIGYFEGKAGADAQFPFKLVYQVDRQEAGLDAEGPLPSKLRNRFLAADRLVPTSGKPIELLGSELPSEPLAAGAALYDLVEKHMKYGKTQPGWGKGDSVWACDSRTGNCTDFHSLFISLARSQSIPARFEIGFPLPTDMKSGKVKGYHCWAWFYAQGRGWMPVDISEADKDPEMRDYYFGNLTPDRISFSTGRDIELVPKSMADPLNFFVYPHVEVDGKIWERKNIELEFSFRDHNPTQ